MRTFSLGSAKTDHSKHPILGDVPQIISGQMRIGEKSDDEIKALYSSARDAGVNFFDHADLYGFNVPEADGAYHFCEQRFGSALALSSSEREEIILQTKTSIVLGDEHYFDSSYEHIMASVNRSLAALKTDYLDVLLLHRPDALIEPEEVARAFSELEETGKVRGFGVSNYTPRQIDLLKTAVEQPILVNQVQLSVTHAPIIAQGINSNIEGQSASVTLDGGGVVDYARINGITLQAWSPFQAGNRRGLVFDRATFPQLNKVFDELAQKYGVDAQAIATAWITRHPANIQVVLGSTNPDRVAKAAAGADVRLTRAEWYRIFETAGYHIP